MGYVSSSLIHMIEERNRHITRPNAHYSFSEGRSGQNVYTCIMDGVNIDTSADVTIFE